MRKILCRAALAAAVLFVVVLAVNGHIKRSVSDRILTSEQAGNLKDIDCILVLGCGVRDDGSPSDMLADRLETALTLYNTGVSDKLLMSGDHGRTDYDEVNTMKRCAVESGISSEDVFMDHAGFSTYESLYRAGEIFEADRVIIVTQGYHLYRALYVARSLGIEAWGAPADLHTYRGQTYRDLREVAARIKDSITVIAKPKPTYLGEVIPVSGNGDLTND